MAGFLFILLKSRKTRMAKSLSIVPEDKVAQIYLERCWKFKKNPPAEDWDGSITLYEK